MAGVLLLAGVSLCAPGVSLAAKIFTYRDDNGRLVFTDRASGEGKLVGVEQVEAREPKYRLSVQKSGADDDFTISAYNEYYGPVEVRFLLEDSANMESDCTFPCSIVVKPRERRDLLKMRRGDKRRGFSYNLSRQVMIGDPAAVHNDAILYALPIWPLETGQVVISQAFDGSRTHGDIQNRYAIDIPVPEGTPVHAARAGVVMDIATDFFRVGSIDKYKDRANFVRILHDDGTMGLYAHLQLESTQVRMGERVQAGQIIARSGNTGFSGGPHLHFVVQKNFGGELRAVPFQVGGPFGEGVVPQEGMVFR